MVGASWPPSLTNRLTEQKELVQPVGLRNPREEARALGCPPTSDFPGPR
ncbi:hypothetical protein C731_0101 [Mycolicibacterium hassiacum DSM 44199]|uniref:Uncharacterized protein n=1 Tax=Mycolicibacterium hassiacum (strain DSM 44199 / CIP 105218 / JCM 12690 / 3849) TaxID=1122247 RepID=K5BL24_MYCHD|nr:hypothetical protein C731_0101 [Mycolicibacterium hassiacum DSM 44199]